MAASSTTPQQGVFRRLFWPVYAPSILFGVAGGAVIPVQVLAAMHLGASASFAALIVAITGAIGLLTTVHAGRLIDRLGDRRAMLLATVVAGVLTLATITALAWGGRGALWLFMAASFLEAPAANVWGLARQTFVAERVDASEVGRAMTGLGGTMRIGRLVGPLLGSLLLLRLPLWSVYVLSLACAVLALVVLYLPALGGRLEEGPQQPGPGSGATGSATPGGREPLAVDWTRVWLAGIAITTLQLARVAQPVVVQLFGVHTGLSTATISLLVAIGAAVEIVLMFPGGYLKDRLGRARILVTCLLVYGGGFLLMVPLEAALGLAGTVLAVLVMAVGNGLGAGVNMTIGADLSPSRGRGRFLGIWAVFSGAGALGGPLLVSALVGGAGVPAAVYAIGGLAVFGAGWMTGFARRIDLPRGIRR